MGYYTGNGTTTNGVFALIDDPRQTRESDYIRYTIEARREMV